MPPEYERGDDNRDKRAGSGDYFSFFCELILNEGDVDVIMFESFGVIVRRYHIASPSNRRLWLRR